VIGYEAQEVTVGPGFFPITGCDILNEALKGLLPLGQVLSGSVFEVVLIR